MANFVTKKDGTRVAFDIEKIKTGIKFAAQEAGHSEEESSHIASEVADLVVLSFEGIEEVTTVEVRDKVLSELDTLHPNVAQAWRHYEEGKGH